MGKHELHYYRFTCDEKGCKSSVDSWETPPEDWQFVFRKKRYKGSNGGFYFNDVCVLVCPKHIREGD